jgi:hypothetical protein
LTGPSDTGPGDVPNRALLAVSGPFALAAFSDGVPAGFVLPVVIAPANCEMRLSPNDLGPHLEALRLERPRNLRGKLAGMPDVGGISGKQLPGLTPVRPIIVLKLAEPGRP